jgi:hypothetical protein
MDLRPEEMRLQAQVRPEVYEESGADVGCIYTVTQYR